MKKIEKIFLGCTILAALGIIVFWVAGFYNHYQVSAISFFVAGASATIALIAEFINQIKKKSIGY